MALATRARELGLTVTTMAGAGEGHPWLQEGGRVFRDAVESQPSRSRHGWIAMHEPR